MADQAKKLRLEKEARRRQIMRDMTVAAIYNRNVKKLALNDFHIGLIQARDKNILEKRLRREREALKRGVPVDQECGLGAQKRAELLTHNFQEYVKALKRIKNALTNYELNQIQDKTKRTIYQLYKNRNISKEIDPTPPPPPIPAQRPVPPFPIRVPALPNQVRALKKEREVRRRQVLRDMTRVAIYDRNVKKIPLNAFHTGLIEARNKMLLAKRLEREREAIGRGVPVESRETGVGPQAERISFPEYIKALHRIKDGLKNVDLQKFEGKKREIYQLYKNRNISKETAPPRPSPRPVPPRPEPRHKLPPKIIKPKVVKQKAVPPPPLFEADVHIDQEFEQPRMLGIIDDIRQIVKAKVRLSKKL